MLVCERVCVYMIKGVCRRTQEPTFLASFLSVSTMSSSGKSAGAAASSSRLSSRSLAPLPKRSARKGRKLAASSWMPAACRHGVVAGGLLLLMEWVGALLVAPPRHGGDAARHRLCPPASPRDTYAVFTMSPRLLVPSGSFGTLCAAARGRRASDLRPAPEGEFLEAMRKCFALRNGGDGDGGRRRCRGAAVDTLEFAGPMTASQRALLHAYSARVGLGHESSGHGNARGVVVWRKNVSARLDELEGALVGEERAARASRAADADRQAAFVLQMLGGLELCRQSHAASPDSAVAHLLEFLLGTGRANPGVVGEGVGGGGGAAGVASEEEGERGGGGEEEEEKDEGWLDKSLSPEQRQAVLLCMGEGLQQRQQAAVVSGAAGTGKSRVLVELVRQRLRLGQRVLV